MTIDELMNRHRQILDGLPEWLTLEAASTDRIYLKERFNRWIEEVQAVQQATQRVPESEE